MVDDHSVPASSVDARRGMRTRVRQAADPKYVMAFTPSVSCELRAEMPIPLSVDPTMTPRLEVIWSRALAAVNRPRGTMNATEAIMAGPNTVDAMEFRNTSPNR